MSDKDLRRPQRAALLAAGVAACLVGVLGGLWRLDWNLPLPGTEPASFHGALMVSAFFGTLIGLEHAAAYARRAAYLAPASAALGGIGTALGAPHLVSASLLLVGSTLLAILAIGNWRRDRTLYAAVALAGALCGALGNGLWLAEFPASQAAGPWLAFLVLSAVGERLELSHLKLPSGIQLWLPAAATLLLVAGVLAWPWQWLPAIAAVGVALVSLSLWLLVHDVARLDLRHHRQARFTAVCVVGGYVWLAVGGLVLPFAGAGGPLYDAALHAVFVGFVFSALMAHAPAIVPALLDVELPYTPRFYVHLVILDASLLARIGGDLLAQPALRDWGGLGNALALTLFLLIAADAVRRAGLRQVG